MTAPPLLTVEGLTVAFGRGRRQQRVVEDVGFHVSRGETLGIVGESGSGKTVATQAIVGLAERRGGTVLAGTAHFDGADLIGMPPRQLRALRGRRIGMIFQQPTRALNPAFTVGDQIAETLRRHEGLSRRAAWARAVELLDLVQIANAAERARQYPHTFSGGMCQRVMIAIALACRPQLLIADEPTTALDVTVQATILQLLRDLRDETGVAVLLISHDLGVIAEMADRIVVMYAGQVVETGRTDDVLAAPHHPYSAGLLAALPTGGRERLVAIPGTVPQPGRMPAGCRFTPRCAHAVAGLCDAAPPALATSDDRSERTSRCIRAGELIASGAMR